MKYLSMATALVVLAACSPADIKEMEARRLAKMNLSENETAVAAAFIEGFKKEVGLPVLKTREFAWAACYAKTHQVPSRFDRVHISYLQDYTAIDEDFYPWFKSRGVSDKKAYELRELISSANEECKPANMLKKRFAKTDN